MWSVSNQYNIPNPVRFALLCEERKEFSGELGGLKLLNFEWLDQYFVLAHQKVG
jgi:hypothetical protein